jgi:hypothetical protein
MDMSLLDSMVGMAFRDEKVGRVVVFSGGRRDRGYIVRSPADELKIRSFLKMFYFAHFSIVLLGMLLANGCAMFFINIHAFGEPAEHFFRSMSISIGFYGLLVGVPYFLLWRSYKNALSSFASAQDEVLISGNSAGRKPWSVIAGLIAVGALILIAAILFLVRAKP